MFIKAQSYGQTLHSESKQSSTHTSTKIVWPQRQAKITYTHCDRPQPGLKRRDQLVIQVPASMYVCVPKQFVGDLSANLSQTHYTYAPSEPYCTYAPCDPQRNNGRNEVKWPAEQPVDSALSSLSFMRPKLTQRRLCFAPLFRRQSAVCTHSTGLSYSLRVLFAWRRFSSCGWVQLPLVSRPVRLR